MRYQSAAELVADLKRLRRDNDSSDVRPAVTGSRYRILAGIAGSAAIVAVVIATYLGLWGTGRTTSNARMPATSRDFDITQLTTSGNALTPSISPDGKYVAYVQQEGDVSSLWIRQVSTTSAVRILQGEPGIGLMAPTITPDGNYVDFIQIRNQPGVAQTYDLWRAPFLGGGAKRLVENAWGPVGWSPDGTRMAFVGTDTNEGSTHLLVADPDGGRQRVIATRRSPDMFIN